MLLTDDSLFEIPPFEAPYLGGVFHLRQKGGALCGIVLDSDDKPVENAAACLYRMLSDGRLKPEACVFSDRGGRFLLGPICGGESYYLKIDGCDEARFYPIGQEEAERDSPAVYQKYRDVYNHEEG